MSLKRCHNQTLAAQPKKLKFITAPRVNSRGGCKTCKTRKKKCDEKGPFCSFCEFRGYECKYEPIQKEIPRNKSPKVQTLKPLDKSSNQITEYQIANLNPPASSISLFDINLDSRLLISPSSKAFLLLNENSFYIDFFYHHVSTSLTVSLKSKNYFQSLYSMLALNEEAFTFLVAAWSSRYYKSLRSHNNPADSEVKGYFQRALKRFDRYFRVKNSGLDYYFQIVFYLALVKSILTYGGTQKWRAYFKKACDLVVEYGGLEKFCSDLWYSNDTRFIVSSIQHVDILSSNALFEGTIFPIEEYRRVFSTLKAQRGQSLYGVDPLQGCQQNLILIMGDIMNHKVMIEQRQLELELISLDDYPESKANHLKYVEQAVNNLQDQLDNCFPDWSDFPVELDQDIINPYEQLFEMSKLCCQAYLELYIKRVTPKSFKIQTLISEIFVLFDTLLYTKMCLILVIPLLTCGVCTFNEQDKIRVKEYARKLENLSVIQNVEKCWLVVQRAWELNPDGNSIVDWSQICKEFGWELNIC